MDHMFQTFALIECFALEAPCQFKLGYLSKCISAIRFWDINSQLRVLGVLRGTVLVH